MDNLKIGSFLQALRKAKGLTQSDVADYFEISNKTVSKWECGSALPEIPMLKALAEYYNVTVDEILNGGKAVKNEEVLEKKKKDNENYFVEQKSKKIDFWMMLSYLVLALGFIFIYILGYTTKRADIATFFSIGIYFSSIALYFIGRYMVGNIDDEFNEENKKYIKNKKFKLNTIYFIGLTYSFIMSIIFYIIPKSVTDIITAVPNIGFFLGINLIGLLISIIIIGIIFYREELINKDNLLTKSINISHIVIVFIFALVLSHMEYDVIYVENAFHGVEFNMGYVSIPYFGIAIVLTLIIGAIFELIFYIKKSKLIIIPKVLIMICFITLLICINYDYNPDFLVKYNGHDFIDDIYNYNIVSSEYTMVYYITNYFVILVMPIYLVFDIINFMKKKEY